MKYSIRFFLSILFLSLMIQGSAQIGDTSVKTLIVFFDGLRPDYITPELMPNLYAFRQAGCYGKQHHSVYPTVTRVNASSYSTGSYPATHGLMGNTVYFPEVDSNKGLNTGEAEEMEKVIAATHGHLLTAITLGEALQAVGAKMMVFSSGSTGQALMQNHTISGGATINPGLILPASLKEKIVSEIGPIPAHAKPNTPQHIWVTDALIRYGLLSNGPLVSAIWFSDPDGSAHSDGIGSPAAVASIKSVDHEFGRILEALKNKNLLLKYNIIISTDHGFVTHVGKEGLQDFLLKNGFKKDKESEDVVVAEGAIYVKNHDKETIEKIVRSLQSQEWVGAIFTKAGNQKMKGSIPGTLSFESVHWNHPDRSADILVDVNWNDQKNSAGYEGTSFSRGVAGHGSLSPYEVHIPLIAAGPGFKKSFEDDLPTSNVDLVPTILYLYNIPQPSGMEGRIMHELLVEKNIQLPGPKLKKEKIETEANIDGGKYKLILETSILGNYRYVDFAKVQRKISSGKQLTAGIKQP